MSAKDDISNIAALYSSRLEKASSKRVLEMEKDDDSHYLIYRVLGISEKEGNLIDVYQNKGRFLYKYAGSFLEEATKHCFKLKHPKSGVKKIKNTLGSRPKTFEIDCLVGNSAYEIKWRDATTDGDHITKEHTRIKVIKAAGFTPVRIMYYYPNRDQAKRIQSTLETLYKGIGGEYYYAETAWNCVKTRTGIDLKKILEEIADERASRT
jgi:hypothetical protein